MGNANIATSGDQARHLQRIEIDGFTVMENLLDDTGVDLIKRELQPYLQGEKMGRNNFEGEHSERVYALLAKAPSIATIIEHPLVLELIDQLLPKNYLLSAALAINVHPGETPQPFHVDSGGGGLPWPTPCPRFGISTLWAFDDFTASNGATEVVPGSHLWNEQRDPRPDELLKITMPAGSAVVFDGRLLHRGGANTSKHSRLGITPQYCAPGLRQIESMLLAVPPQVAANYSDRIQNLLGYSIMEPGFMGYVDGVHPKKLIDPDYLGRKHRAELPPS